MTVSTVGVRELRQNLSVYLRRVKEGETLRVTERGEPVAVLSPIDSSASVLDRMIAEGRATAPVGDLLDAEPYTGPVDVPISEALEEQREDRI